MRASRTQPQAHGRITVVMPRLLYARDSTGSVTHWGSPDGVHLVQVADAAVTHSHEAQERGYEEAHLHEQRVEAVPCWSVLWVSVWVIFAHSSMHGQGWQHYSTYAVEDYEAIRPVFDAYFGTAGLYNRARFEVEEWVWTREGGWEPEDWC